MGNPNENENKQPADESSSDETSKKTLADIEETQKDSDATGANNSSAPSPDGQFDEADRGGSGKADAETR
jgi:hypothetical protein